MNTDSNVSLLNNPLRTGTSDSNESDSNLSTAQQSFDSSNKRNESKVLIANLLLILVQIIFSGWHILGSVVIHEYRVNALIFALYREIIASALLFVVVKYLKFTVKIHRIDYYHFLFLGFCSFLNIVGAITSLNYISPSRFAIFQPLTPCIATVLSVCLKKESFSVLKGFGIILAVGGAITVEVWHSNSSQTDTTTSQESNVPLGSAIVFIQCSAMANIIVFQKSLLHKYHSSVVTFVYYAIGSVFTFIMCLGNGILSKTAASEYYFHGAFVPFLVLIYAAVLANCFNYSVFSYVGKILTPSIITLYLTLQPIGTILLSSLIFGDAFTLSQGVGGSMVILGLAVTVYSKLLLDNIRYRDIGDEDGVTDETKNYCLSDDEDFSNSRSNQYVHKRRMNVNRLGQLENFVPFTNNANTLLTVSGSSDVKDYSASRNNTNDYVVVNALILSSNSEHGSINKDDDSIDLNV